MRAEAVSWDDWSVANPPPVADDDKWHVQFAPDEVKIVSLEQLDDLFRLSIVDSETQVWQAGMIEWQPLRVIAGLDEQSAPRPKRAPPKPPRRDASPSVRPAPDATLTASSSVRPVAPTPRSAPPAPARSAHLAPASFYPEPIQAAPSPYSAPIASVAPIAFAATMPVANSVRPLVVSHAPPTARGGGGFGRFLVGMSLLAGVSVTAYRNDLLRDGAHAAHQDALFARLESALGGPAFGTVRALERSAAAQLGFERSSNNEPASAAIAALAPPAPAALTAALGTATPVVSLESLAPERKGQATAATATLTATAVTAAPARAATSFAQPAAASVPAKAPPAKAPPAKAPPAKAPPEVRAAAPKAVEKQAPVAKKPASEMSDRERLNAAIGQSMMQSEAPKAKGNKAKAKGNNEYDPLNPSL